MVKRKQQSDMMHILAIHPVFHAATQVLYTERNWSVPILSILVRLVRWCKWRSLSRVSPFACFRSLMDAKRDSVGPVWKGKASDVCSVVFNRNTRVIVHAAKKVSERWFISRVEIKFICLDVLRTIVNYGLIKLCVDTWLTTTKIVVFI